MNLLDLLLVALLAAAVIVGFRRGAAVQVLSWAGLIVGLVVGALLAPSVAAVADEPLARAGLALATLVLSAIVFDVAGWLLGARIAVAVRRNGFRTADSLAGAAVAGVATLLVVWFLAFNLVQGPFPAVSRQVEGSAIVRGLDAVLPEPPSIVSGVGNILDRFGFPEVFSGLPPLPAGPVEGPSRGEVNRFARAADQSTLRVVGQACDRIQDGSGFVVAAGYVVTNAHVVAGVREPLVQLGQDSVPAVTVLFDPSLDLAVLRVQRSLARPLPLLEEDLESADVGAVLGYPEGGGLQASSAAIVRLITARGLDIYDEGPSEREVYELKATVEPGNSGGPFVTAGGRVAGVVFAASTSRPDVAYALTSTEVAPEVERALGRTAAAGTGPCLS